MEVTLQAKIWTIGCLFLTLATTAQTNAWINEIHYDNASTDSLEAIEVVIENHGLVSDYTVYIYDGNKGEIKEQQTLDSLVAGITYGNFTLYMWFPPKMPNGVDGMALAYQDTLIPGQFLSYEGTFTATDGPANGLTSTDINVSEEATTPVAESLQLSGSGVQYANFTWQEPAQNTFGSVNPGQTLISGNPAPIISNITQTPTKWKVTPNDPVTIAATVTDADGVAGVTLYWGNTSGNLPNAISMNLSSGDSYASTTQIPPQMAGDSVFYKISASDTFSPSATSTSTEYSYTSEVPIPAPSLIISEIADPSDNYEIRFVEIYNNGTAYIDFATTSVFLAKYANGNSAASSVQLTGGVSPGDFYVIAWDDSLFHVKYGFHPELESGIAEGNGNDVFALYVGKDWNLGGTLFDVFGAIGTDGTGELWEYLNSRAVRNNLMTTPDIVWKASEWNINGATVTDMTPGTGEFSTNYSYNGSWSPTDPNGITTAVDNISITNGEANLTQDVTIHDVHVASGAILNVQGVLTLRGDMLNDGEITFKNNGAQLGQLATIPVGSTVSGSGDFSVERYIPARRAFRFVTSAIHTTTSIHDNWQEGAVSNNDDPHPGYGTHITGTTIDQTNGFDATISGNPSLFLFDNTTQTWSDIANTDVNTLVAGKAYRLYVRGDRSIDVTSNTSTPTNTTLRATGDLVIGDHLNTNLGQVAGDFNFIGNPYQAIVDMNEVLENSTNLNPHYYYVWDPNLNVRGGYVTVDLPSGIATPEVGVDATDANQYLQPGQAAFVRTLNSGPASILFEETDKAPFQIATQVFGGIPIPKAEINIQLYEAQAYINNGSVADGVLVSFDPSGSNAVLPNDAVKLGNQDENVALLNGQNAYLSIENRAMPMDGEILHLFTNQYRHNNYTFEIEMNGFSGAVTAYLKDAYLQTQTQLPHNNSTLINFSIDQNIRGSTASDRFSIQFEVVPLSTNKIADNGFQVYPNPANGRFFIADIGKTTGEIQISFFDLLGREVHRLTKNGNSDRIEVSTAGIKPGMYLLKITNAGITMIGKVLLK